MGYISRKSAATILHSARTAQSIGKPFTHFITLRLWELGSTPDTVTSDFSKIRQWFRRWSDRPSTRKGMVVYPRNGTATHIYAIENTEDSGQVHVHWVLHLNEANEARFLMALTTRLKKQFHISDEEFPLTAIHSKEVTNAEGVKLYLVKAIDPLYGDLWNIEHKEGGYVKGRRADASRNLGPSTWRPLKAEYKKTRIIKRTR